MYTIFQNVTKQNLGTTIINSNILLNISGPSGLTLWQKRKLSAITSVMRVEVSVMIEARVPRPGLELSQPFKLAKNVAYVYYAKVENSLLLPFFQTTGVLAQATGWYR